MMFSIRRFLIGAGALVAFFLYRLAYGLSSEFFFEDHTQIYLMGLRYFATGEWPYFGPDVVWTESEIPGALQPLLVGLPLKIVAAPEAPFVLLNILSVAALAAFAWYITRRLPQLPHWLVWGWLMTVPWTLDISTNIVNPSYVLAPALIFFLGFFEAVPVFRAGVVPQWLAFVFMGAAASWILQIHMSWPLLLPYMGMAWLWAWKDGVRSAAITTAALIVGLLVFGIFLIPTLAVYGIEGGSGGTLRNLRPHFVNPSVAVTTLARFFSFVSLEIWRFMATDDGKRQMFLLDHLWIAPLALVAWVASIWQPIWMLREWFRTRSPFPEWRWLRWLVALTILLIYASYWVVLQPAQAHAFYVVAPISFVFAAYCWTFVDSPRWRRVAAALLVVNVLFHAGQAWIQALEKSLYRAREVVATAIREKQPEMFGHRRAFAISGGPTHLNDPARPYDLKKDVQIVNDRVSTGPRRVALWTFTVRNLNERVAYRDVLYHAHYYDASGKQVDLRYDVIKDVFQPGAMATIQVNDGFVAAPFSSATIEVLGADALLPIK
jgi:hypothetical protein